MATITLLQLQRKRSDRVNVFLDEEYAFSLALDLAASLRRGQELDSMQIMALKAEDAFRSALDRAVGLLSRRPRSKEEIRRALRKRDVEEQVVDRVVERLVERDYLDDEAFAAWWVENRLDHKPRGRWALRSELTARGVANADMAGALSGVDDEAVARQLALSRAHRYRGLDFDDLRRKLGSYLRRRGFTYDTVRTALEATWQSLHTPPPDQDDAPAS